MLAGRNSDDEFDDDDDDDDDEKKRWRVKFRDRTDHVCVDY